MPVIHPKQKTQQATTVRGTRPAGMNVPTGLVATTGPRRPAGGYSTSAKAFSGSAGVVVPMGGGQPMRFRRRFVTVGRKTDPNLRMGARSIVPTTGFSLSNLNSR
jgi:hypothetical protein